MLQIGVLALALVLGNVASQVCIGPNEVLMFTKYEDSTCDGPGDMLDEPTMACRCRNRYVRHCGQCIRGSKCNSPCSGAKEEYVLTEYEDSTCDGPGLLMPEPKNACRCIYGYVRNNEGVCIRFSECPSHCHKPDETYVRTKYEDKTCAGPGAPLKNAIKACRCRSGFVRFGGNCIRSCDCPTCGENEVFAITDLQDPTCVGIEKSLDKVVEECRCKNGYVRHKRKCIHPWKCPKCDQNEVYIRAEYDDSLCTIKGKRFDSSVEGCFCECNHVRYNGKCILKEECPTCDGPNEILVYTNYEDSRCSIRGEENDEFEEVCRCAENHVRFNGKCIHVNDCPSCGDNEELIYSILEDSTCAGKEESLSEKIEKCRCLRGYVRHEKKCVPLNLCPECDFNEIYKKSSVEDSYCSVKGAVLDPPEEGCFCDYDYVRYNGYCVPKEDCPKCMGKNEILMLTDEEDPTCTTRGEELDDEFEICRCIENHVRFNGQCIPKNECPTCGKNEELTMSIWVDATCVNTIIRPLPEPTEACRCLEGYVRKKGECVLRAECPKCDENEIYTFTKQDDSMCTVQGSLFDSETEGCFCNEGHVRFNGACIPREDCPSCDKPNEILVLAKFEDSTCIVDGEEMSKLREVCRCKPKHVRHNGVCILERTCPNCDDNEVLVKTKETDPTCVGPSEPLNEFIEGCRCVNGLVRYKGVCVSPNSCPSCGTNEIYKYSDYDDSLCTVDGKCLDKTVEGCFCKESMVRYNGNCIPIDECPICDGQHEILMLATREDSTCVAEGDKLSKPKEICRCIEDFVRFNNKCIPKDKCPICYDNEELTKSTATDSTCAGPEKPSDEPFETCRCISGHVRYGGVCIPKDDCPKCGENEIFKLTTSGDPLCTVKGDPFLHYEEGCFCIDEHVRFNGLCIPRNECPTCDGPNEKLTLTSYEDPRCDTEGEEMIRPLELCRCIDGHVRFNWECIPREKCPICGTNEIFKKTTNRDGTCVGPKEPLNKPIEGCYCVDDHVRYQGVCIPNEDCPTCKVNEIYTMSSKADSLCSVKGEALEPPQEGCYCVQDHVRYFNKCIPKDDCPKCGEKEMLIFTPYEDSTCILTEVTLPEPNEYCRCIKDHVRYDGKCIPSQDCPKCSGNNEALVLALYEDSTCTTYGAPMKEPKELCRCVNDAVRYNGKCIPEDECPNCHCENESLVTALYEDSTCTTSGAAMSEPKEACRCYGGFVRHNGHCIPVESCPICPGQFEYLVQAQYEDSTCTVSGAMMAESAEVCRCNNGFVRMNGECISKDKCPTCSGSNEIFVYAQYEDHRCSGPGLAMSEPAELCRCKNGFVRYHGCCIPREECPLCPGEHESLIFATNEDSTCTTEGIAMSSYDEVCRCHIGYVRHIGVCIAKDQCPCCPGENETYITSNYKDATCCDEAEYTDEPEEGCRCKIGYVRHEGCCIPIEECP